MGRPQIAKIYFPTYLYQDFLLSQGRRLAILLRELKSDSLKLMENDRAGQEWSLTNYSNGYTSYSSLSQLHLASSLFAELKTQIDRHVHRFAAQLGFDKKCTLQMVSCWLNVMPPGATHSLHLHPLSVISGTFYVDLPRGSGLIKFEDPRLSKMMAAPFRRDPYSSGGFAKLHPLPGQVILFESWLRHEVEPNRGKGQRISISFNYS